MQGTLALPIRRSTARAGKGTRSLGMSASFRGRTSLSARGASSWSAACCLGGLGGVGFFGRDGDFAEVKGPRLELGLAIANGGRRRGGDGVPRRLRGLHVL